MWSRCPRCAHISARDSRRRGSGCGRLPRSERCAWWASCSACSCGSCSWMSSPPTRPALRCCKMAAVGRVYAIAINTFREAVRDKVLYGVLGFGCLILLFTLAIAELSLNEQQRVIEDVGLASISLFSVIVSIFLGSSLLYKEIERKTLYVILPKPISRTEFLLGKYFG